MLDCSGYFENTIPLRHPTRFSLLSGVRFLCQNWFNFAEKSSSIGDYIPIHVVNKVCFGDFISFEP